MHPLINIATEAARSAGKIILKGFERPDLIKRHMKEGQDFTTDTDQRAEQAIIEIIHKAYPQHAILAEESGEIGKHDFTWIIDPLDGTKNFSHGYPHFAVSIAVRIEDVISHAVIYDPIRDELFSANRGQGAQLNGRRLRMLERPIHEALIGLSYPSPNSEEALDLGKKIALLSRASSGFRKTGSASLDMAYLAASRLDVYIANKLHLWDYAAGALLIQEAGGIISDWHASEHYWESNQLLAASPKLHKQILKWMT